MQDTKKCGKCKQEKELNLFYKHSGYGAKGVRAHCKACYDLTHQKYMDAHPEKHVEHWANRLKRWYGITSAEYHVQVAAQNGGCGLCGAYPTKKRLHVDHDHSCENHTPKHACKSCVRGLLCGLCNTVLAQLESKPILQNDHVRKYLGQRPFLTKNNT